MPELSEGRSESDLLKVPNIPLLAAITKAESLDAGMNFAFRSVLQFTNPKEFHKKTVNEFLFGYTDSFTSMASIAKEKAGLLASRRGKRSEVSTRVNDSH